MSKTSKTIFTISALFLLAVLYFQSQKNSDNNIVQYNSCEDIPSSSQYMCDIDNYFNDFHGDFYLFFELENTEEKSNNNKIPRTEVLIRENDYVIMRGVGDDEIWLSSEEFVSENHYSYFRGLFYIGTIHASQSFDNDHFLIFQAYNYKRDLNEKYNELFSNGEIELEYNIVYLRRNVDPISLKDTFFEYFEVEGQSESYKLYEEETLNINGIDYETIIIRKDYKSNNDYPLIDYYWYSKELKNILKSETFSVVGNGMIEHKLVSNLIFALNED